MRTTRSRLALVAVALTLALAGAACSSSDEPDAAPAVKEGPSGPACGVVPGDGPGSFGELAKVPVATAAGNSAVLSTLATSVVEADLAETLNGDGPFTVFAPANSAFGELPADDLDALLADKDALGNVLTYHVVAGDYSAEQLVDEGTLDSVEGQPLTFAAQGDSFTVDGARVLCGAIPVSNGVVYVIDSVLLPGSVAEPVSGPVGPLCPAIPPADVATLAGLPVGTAAGNVGLLSTLTAAVEAAELGATLNGDGPFIVLAPVDDAFSLIPAETLNGLLEDPEALGNILTYHVIGGSQTPTELIQAGEVATVQGGMVDIAKDGQSFTVNGAKVLCGPITVGNGVVYLIDNVLTPPV